MRRSVCSFCLCLLAAWSFSEGPGRFSILLGGKQIGTTTVTRAADGTQASHTDLDLLGSKIVSDLAWKMAEGRAVTIELAQKMGKSDGHITVSDSKAQITGADKPITLKAMPKALFSNYHPAPASTIFAQYDRAKGGKQSLNVFIVDGAREIPCAVLLKGTRPFMRDAKAEVVEDWEFTIGPVTIHYCLNGNGDVVGLTVPAQNFDMIGEGYDGVFVDPTTLYKELSQPTFSTKDMVGVKAKMRDGALLVSDIALPTVDGKYPTILMRTPYGRMTQFLGGKADWWAKRGYVVVVQDCRGRHDSDGEWDPFVHERKDGYDTIDWISKQPWSDGNVGMIGGSYAGAVQWQAAVEGHPALKCIVPQVSPPDAFFNLPYDHGVFFLWGNVWWANIVKGKISDLGSIGQPLPNINKLSTLPLSRIPKALFGQDIPFYDRWLDRDTQGAWGGWNFQDDMSKVTIPALQISGWWDGDGIGTKTNWARMAGLGRKNQWLIDGPWSHGFNASTQFADVDYGSASVLELDSVYLRWFDTWLKKKQVGQEKVPHARIFVTGANEWRDMDAWPDSRSTSRTLYLSAPGPANGATSMGELVDKPQAEQEPSRYTFNPAQANIPKGMGDSAASDLATTKLEFDKHESDHLVYKTAPLADPLEVGGPIQLDLYFQTTAKDVDFFALLVDIDEKGQNRLVGLPGKIGGRYLASWNKPTLLIPGKQYKATIDLWDTAHRFAKGHRMGVVVTSGMFPMYARNLGTGEPIKNATRMVTSSETIWHDIKHPSALRFRVLPPVKR